MPMLVLGRGWLFLSHDDPAIADRNGNISAARGFNFAYPAGRPLRSRLQNRRQIPAKKPLAIIIRLDLSPRNPREIGSIS